MPLSEPLPSPSRARLCLIVALWIVVFADLSAVAITSSVHVSALALDPSHLGVISYARSALWWVLALVVSASVGVVASIASIGLWLQRGWGSLVAGIFAALHLPGCPAITLGVAGLLLWLAHSPED